MFRCRAKNPDQTHDISDRDISHFCIYSNANQGSPSSSPPNETISECKSYQGLHIAMTKIAVITPYYKESIDYLQKCHQSVLSQALDVDIDIDHFFIADGHPNDVVASWPIKHVVLPVAHADNGNTPRAIGSVLARVEGYEYIAYLDADNWFHPNHIQSLLNLRMASGADVCTSFRTIHTLDSVELNIQEKSELELKHVDTSCLMLHRNAFEAVDMWLQIPKQLAPVCDRVFLKGLMHKRFKILSTRMKTVAFRSQYRTHYLQSGLPPPIDSKDDVNKDAYQWLLTLNGLKHTFEKLGFVPV